MVRVGASVFFFPIDECSLIGICDVCIGGQCMCVCKMFDDEGAYMVVCVKSLMIYVSRRCLCLYKVCIDVYVGTSV